VTLSLKANELAKIAVNKPVNKGVTRAAKGYSREAAFALSFAQAGGMGRTRAWH
jgi:hypothetical protein